MLLQSFSIFCQLLRTLISRKMFLLFLDFTHNMNIVVAMLFCCFNNNYQYFKWLENFSSYLLNLRGQQVNQGAHAPCPNVESPACDDFVWWQYWRNRRFLWTQPVKQRLLMLLLYFSSLNSCCFRQNAQFINREYFPPCFSLYGVELSTFKVRGISFSEFLHNWSSAKIVQIC